MDYSICESVKKENMTNGHDAYIIVNYSMYNGFVFILKCLCNYTTIFVKGVYVIFVSNLVEDDPLIFKAVCFVTELWNNK